MHTCGALGKSILAVCACFALQVDLKVYITAALHKPTAAGADSHYAFVDSFSLESEARSHLIH